MNWPPQKSLDFTFLSEDSSAFLKNLVEEEMYQYRLIEKLLGPLFKKCIEISSTKNDFDWLHIPFFEFLLTSNIKKLAQIEKNLEKIYNNIGSDQFEQLCNNLILYTKHKTINGIHNKLLDFYSELEGMQKFIDEGYTIKLISCSSAKTPDFQAIKSNHMIFVECKFKHSSNPINTYIKRHIRFLSLFHPSLYRNNILLSHDITFEVSGEFPKDLRQEHIDIIKEFISDIVHKQPDTHAVTLPCINKNRDSEKEILHSCKIIYQRKKMLAPALVTIKEQAVFTEKQLKEFDKNSIERLIERANMQLEAYIKNNYRDTSNIFKHIFILAQLDDPISMTWENENLIASKPKKRQGVTIKNVSAIG